MSVFLCCLDVSYCMRCLMYWDRFDRAEEEGGVWERTLWRYWRCWSEEEDINKYDLTNISTDTATVTQTVTASPSSVTRTPRRSRTLRAPSRGTC